MRHGTRTRTAILLITAAVVLTATVPGVFADKRHYAVLSNEQALHMLDQIESDIREYYFDPSLGGTDLSKAFSEARTQIAAAHSQDEALIQIAGAVDAMRDSHTRFVPPERPYTVDSGFAFKAIGDSACYVTAVRPGSDAEAKGLKPGDQIISINNVRLARQDINTIRFGYRVFPQSGFHLNVRSPAESPKSLVVLTKVIPGQLQITNADVRAWVRSHPSQSDRERSLRQGNESKFFQIDKKILFWKLPSFAIDPHDLDDQVRRSHSFEYLVLDLRGNTGGRTDALRGFLGEFFDHDVTFASEQRRKDTTPMVAKTHGKSGFQGKLIVLIDSDTASAAEIFTRTIQLEKRGTVLGDLSSGRVMESQRFVHAVPLDQENVTDYGATVTVARLVMSDGKSLEGVGVMPDERIIPTPEDLASGRDPVLARAATLAGVDISPEKAGTLFPFQWEGGPVIID
jgi:C-terminal processing protease CtpA/Prc